MNIMSVLVIGSSIFGFGQAAPDVVVHTTEGTKPAASWLAIDANFGVKLGAPSPTIISGRDLVSLQRVGAGNKKSLATPFVELTTGDRFPLAVPLDVRLADETLHATLAAPLAGNFVVPQAALAHIAFSNGDDPSGKRSGDRLILRDGDRIDGKLVGLDSKEARLTIAGQTVIVPIGRLAQVAFDPEFQAKPRSKAAFADVILKGDVRLSLPKLVSTDTAGQLTGETFFGNRVTFAASDLVVLRMRRGRAVYLDELKPKSYEMTPFLDVSWPLVVGKTLKGESLRFAGDTYPLGLAMHARSRVTFAVDPAYLWFEALVAVDSSAGSQGAVRIDVELDGRSSPKTSRLLKSGDVPVPLRIDVSGAKSLTLVTDFGPRGDVGGQALWADARFLRE